MEQPQTCFQLLLIRSLQELGLLFRLAANEKERQKNRVFCKLLQPLSCPWSEWVGFGFVGLLGKLSRGTIVLVRLGFAGLVSASMGAKPEG